MIIPDERLLLPLRSIRNILLLATLCLVSLVGINIYYIVHGIQTDREARLGYSFSDQADSLYRMEEWNELLNLALKRQRQKPRDAGGFFWAGIASFHLEQLDQAEESFRQALLRDRRGEKTIQTWIKSLNEKRQSLKKPSAADKRLADKRLADKKPEDRVLEVILTDRNLYGTVWIDQESGSTYTFQAEGFLHYTTKSKLKGTGTWKKLGHNIVFELNGFARYRGVRRNNVMEGSAEDEFKRKWKWKMIRQL